MSGTLYLCATPIGNLEDITYRVLRTLKEVDLIAAEDTRNTIKLLNHFDIKTPMTSYHKYSTSDKTSHLISLLTQGTNIALVTDAGTPAISDPGEEFVRLAYEAGITVTSLPGACACITALTLSGLSTRRFAFEAFLPAEKKLRQNVLNSLVSETRTMVIYEAPHRLCTTLKQLYDTLGDRKLTLCRELTKLHETVLLTTLADALSYYQEHDPKGEYVLVIEGIARETLDKQQQQTWQEMDLQKHMQIYLDQNLSKKEAMKKVAADRGVSKRDIYQQLLKET
jgi:16S rRNA (cytidine1402-2'-O)-methyltransferase